MATRSRNVSCPGCNTRHPRPVSKRCTRSSLQAVDTTPDTTADEHVQHTTEDQGQDVNLQMLALLQNLGSKMDTLTNRVSTLETVQTDVSTCLPAIVPAPAASDTIIPTLDSLRSFPEVQMEVARRVDELSQQPGPCNVGKNNLLSNRQSMKTGCYRGRDDVVIQHVIWPQELCSSRSVGEVPDYDDLTPTEFIVGFLRTVIQQPAETQTQMLTYGIDLFSVANDSDWNSAKAGHAAVLTEMELGKFDWDSNLTLLERVRERNSRGTHSSVSDRTAKGGSTSVGIAVCSAFNSSGCRYDKQHKEEGVWYKHWCSVCLDKEGK